MFDTLTNQFVQQLRRSGLSDVESRTYAGTRFLYISTENKNQSVNLSQMIQEAAQPLIQDTDFTFECRFVRQSKDRWVYRFHFRVPSKKSFCCGNQCPNCILLSSQ
ncbi:hypothetical protein SAMN06264849_104142 [Melghirimyces algeriensis]|uniref:Uncharacterized protein n=1 Tax=Melghirimyces algeriensis TaxID=910412 RepID=A0A521CR22_9BACL|nr:hypothetical protein SAMN06264849_104142 [Melghirimyces algeriensis]